MIAKVLAAHEQFDVRAGRPADAWHVAQPAHARDALRLAPQVVCEFLGGALSLLVADVGGGLESMLALDLETASDNATELVR